ncbi:MAG: TatD family hydrolase [Pasteurellaceae bacterium]|nr:TatD family hydrolase [Pasteurellaceae bacterium]
MPFFDTHTHLDYLHDTTGESLAQLVVNAQRADVQKILIVAVMTRDFPRIQAMCVDFPTQLCYGLGLHPLYIQQHQPADLEMLAQCLAQADPHCCAVAEIGLERGVDELISEGLWRKQCEYLEAQLQLAKQFNLPVNLHSRRAHDQLFPFLKRIDVAKRGVVHGFSGSYEQAKRFVNLGYKIGIGGIISYERANKTRNTIAKLPLDCLVLETDSPDMPVFGFQGQPNRPERVAESFRYLCELRSEPAQIIQQCIWQTSCELFAVN